MECLKELCKCCKYEGCKQENIVITSKNKCKIIKCLQFVKDEEKFKLINYEKRSIEDDI